jgi:hypothetical protein
VWQVGDRVKETSTTAGTGDLVLAGAVAGFQAFSALCANADTIFYAIYGATAWEVGYGTYNSGANSITRTKVLASSNAGALVNFSGETLTLFVDFPAMQGTHKLGRKIVSGVDLFIPPNASLYVSDQLELASGRILEISAGAVLEIG